MFLRKSELMLDHTLICLENWGKLTHGTRDTRAVSSLLIRCYVIYIRALDHMINWCWCVILNIVDIVVILNALSSAVA